MKKRLLLVLTMVMLLCSTLIFSANAAVCPVTGIHLLQTVKHDPTCTEQGYTEVKCTTCGESISITNYVPALDHLWEGEYEKSADGQCYYNYRVCQRTGCGAEGYETEGGINVVYYSVEFINAKAMQDRVKSITVNGKTVEMDHVVLAETYYNQALDSGYVKAGGSYTYTKGKPTRVKDTAYGAYAFTGWTTVVANDTNNTPEIGDRDNYQVTVNNIQKNTQYFAVWEGLDVIYHISFVNSDGTAWIPSTIDEVEVKHGDTIDYKWIHPTRASSVSNDYKFLGWGVGVKDTSGEKYDEYLLEDNLHIKEIPVYSNDSFVAIHEAIPRKYDVTLKNANETEYLGKIEYGSAIVPKKDASGNTWTVTFNETVNGNSKKTVTINNEYRDDTYAYEFRGYFNTNKGHEVKYNSFSVPQYTLDYNDSIFLEYAIQSGKGERVKAGNRDMVLVEEIKDDLKEAGYDYAGTEDTLFYCFEEELKKYNDCMNNNKLYEPGYFDLNDFTYLYLVSEHGDYIYNESGDKLCLEISCNGIKVIEITGSRYSFTKTDAENLRKIILEPAYRSLVIAYPFVVEAIIPVTINGKDTELTPNDYKNTLIVQVKNEYGQLLNRGMTGNSDKYTAKEVVDSKGNKYLHCYCVLTVQKAERYEVSVASTNEKYEGVKTVYWNTYDDMYNSENNSLKMNVLVDMSITDDYNNSLRCFCICHTFLKGIWVRILNILYNLFGIQYECCPHMHAELGDILAY